MNKPTAPDSQGSSTRPYLLRALHDWCTDNGFTPYIAVHVDATVLVPMEYVKNSEIVLNIGFEATSGLQLGNEAIEFRARFGGITRDIHVPVDHVVAIYARENGQGMAFPVPTAAGSAPQPGSAVEPQPAAGQPLRGLRLASTESEAEPASGTTARVPPDEPPEPTSPRPSLKRIK